MLIIDFVVFIILGLDERQEIGNCGLSDFQLKSWLNCSEENTFLPCTAEQIFRVTFVSLEY